MPEDAIRQRAHRVLGKARFVIVETSVVRRAARAVLLDDADLLVAIKRTKPGVPVYWTTPGGGVDPGDPTRRAALVRELREELGAEVALGEQIFLMTTSTGRGVTVQHFYLARLVSLDPELRSGAEYTDTDRGGYVVERIPLGKLADVDLRPPELREFILGNTAALLADAPGPW